MPRLRFDTKGRPYWEDIPPMTMKDRENCPIYCPTPEEKERNAYAVRKLVEMQDEWKVNQVLGSDKIE